MKTSVVESPQVRRAVGGLPPDKRKMVRREMRRLAQWGGREDAPRIKPLAGNLSGYWRLRVARHRIIFEVKKDAGGRRIECLYAWRRDSVYADFEEALLAGRIVELAS
jgi:mRNA-degrading endonuclease RelE of RelBE toxin-antitoxin system